MVQSDLWAAGSHHQVLFVLLDINWTAGGLFNQLHLCPWTHCFKLCHRNVMSDEVTCSSIRNKVQQFHQLVWHHRYDVSTLTGWAGGSPVWSCELTFICVLQDFDYVGCVGHEVAFCCWRLHWHLVGCRETNIDENNKHTRLSAVTTSSSITWRHRIWYVVCRSPLYVWLLSELHRRFLCTRHRRLNNNNNNISCKLASTEDSSVNMCNFIWSNFKMLKPMKPLKEQFTQN